VNRFTLVVALCLLSAVAEHACYKGDPGRGVTDYPPEPPPVERVSDGGRG